MNPIGGLRDLLPHEVVEPRNELKEAFRRIVLEFENRGGVGQSKTLKSLHQDKYYFVTREEKTVFLSLEDNSNYEAAIKIISRNLDIEHVIRMTYQQLTEYVRDWGTAAEAPPLPAVGPEEEDEVQGPLAPIWK